MLTKKQLSLRKNRDHYYHEQIIYAFILDETEQIILRLLMQNISLKFLNKLIYFLIKFLQLQELWVFVFLIYEVCSKSIQHLGIKKSMLCISQVLFNYFQNTLLGSSHTSPISSATAGKRPLGHLLWNTMELCCCFSHNFHL